MDLPFQLPVMPETQLVLLVLPLSLGILLLHLHFDDPLKLIPLELCLLSEPPLLLRLLQPTSIGELAVHALDLGLLGRLLRSGSSLGRLHGTLGTQGIHLCGLVLSLLLHRTQLRSLLLLLRRDALLLRLVLTLAGLFALLVLNDLLLLELLSQHPLLLDPHRRRVGNIHLLHQPLRGQLLLDHLLALLSLQGLDLLQHEGALLIPLLFLLHALGLPVLDLFDDHLRSAALAGQSLVLPDLVHLQGFQALDLHHGVQVPLLLFPLRLDVPLLLYLCIADGDDF
mmetsp:Transcript_8988/g.14260  ORF Transcript_8988/g.14260 Transcript_8988/m.14260 type:complete len:283 (-) Transcript_8988:590-1438(-)